MEGWGGSSGGVGRGRIPNVLCCTDAHQSYITGFTKL